jgi:hypothetical protein
LRAYRSEAFEMRQITPDRIEYCLMSGELVDPFSIPYGSAQKTSFSDCLTVAQQLLSTYWRKEGGTTRAQMKHGKNNPLPGMVRVVGANGEEICRWSVNAL